MGCFWWSPINWDTVGFALKALRFPSQMNSIIEECEASTDVLQNQVDEARERSQRELDELRRQLQEKGAELEKSRQAAKNLRDEVRG